MDSKARIFFCNKVLRFGRSRSSKVDDFGINRKRVCDFVLVCHCEWSYLAPFLRYGDLLAKNCLFFLPLSHSGPRCLCSLWNFAVKLTMRKPCMGH